MSTELNGRMALGVQSGPTLTFSGTGNDWQFIEGMNVTLELDQDHIAIDFFLEGSASVAPGTIIVAVEIDGNIDIRNECRYTPGVTSVERYAGSFFIMAGPGRHQFRLMMVCSIANTFTFLGYNRGMRLMYMSETGD